MAALAAAAALRRAPAARRVSPVLSAIRWTQSNGELSGARGEVTRRTGLLAVKVGMLGTWDGEGRRHALTVLHADGCRVVQVKSRANGDGYDALQVGAGAKKPKHSVSPERGHFDKYAGGADYGAYAYLREVGEFRISPDASLASGTPLDAAHFVAGQRIDVRGVTRGKGFQGPMKRHNFGGQGASHGVSKTHRAHGSTGASQDPGRVWKGKKMAGRMGGKSRTAQSLVIHKIDTERNLIFVRGAVPGAKGNWVRVTDALKAVKPKDIAAGAVPFPTRSPDEDLPAVLEIE